MTATLQTISPATRAYAECALWSSIDEQPGGNGGPPMDDRFDVSDIEPDTLAAMDADVRAFMAANAGDLIGLDDEQVGHDLWLTRNHHGAGFWDRGLGGRGERLTAAAHAMGDCVLIASTYSGPGTVAILH